MNRLKIEALGTEQARNVSEKLKENDGYCPCKLFKNENTKCMCKEFRDEILTLKTAQGYAKGPVICHCGLYQAYIEES